MLILMASLNNTKHFQSLQSLGGFFIQKTSRLSAGLWLFGARVVIKPIPKDKAVNLT